MNPYHTELEEIAAMRRMQINCHRSSGKATGHLKSRETKKSLGDWGSNIRALQLNFQNQQNLKWGARISGTKAQSQNICGHVKKAGSVMGHKNGKLGRVRSYKALYM